MVAHTPPRSCCIFFGFFTPTILKTRLLGDPENQDAALCRVGKGGKGLPYAFWQFAGRKFGFYVGQVRVDALHPIDMLLKLHDGHLQL